MPLMCDFCSAANPPRSYQCAPFLMHTFQGIEQWSDNRWAACNVCARLIDNNLWDALSQRSLETAPFIALLTEKEKAEYLIILKTAHQRFRVAKGQVA